MKRRPRCSLCKTRPAELHGYGSDGKPNYRSRCSTCRAEARVAHGLPARRGKEGMPGAPRCPGCRHVLVKFCPYCGRPVGGTTSGGHAAVASGGGSPDGSAAGGGAADGEDRKLMVLREVGERRGRVSFVEFLAIAARLRYDQAGAEALLGEHLRRVKGDVELTRDGYNRLCDMQLRPPYRLPSLPRASDGNGQVE